MAKKVAKKVANLMYKISEITIIKIYKQILKKQFFCVKKVAKIVRFYASVPALDSCSHTACDDG